MPLDNMQPKASFKDLADRIMINFNDLVLAFCNLFHVAHGFS
jgi:hypothetical protein